MYVHEKNFTFCTTKISYNTQTAVAVIPCSLHNIAVNTKNMDNIKDFHPVDLLLLQHLVYVIKAAR